MMRFVPMMMVAAVAMVLVSSHAQAAEQYMVLYPKQRAAHQVVMDKHKADYKARGRDFVNHLYATGGEEPMPEAASEYTLDEAIKTRPVNVDEVAKIVKENSADTALPLQQ